MRNLTPRISFFNIFATTMMSSIQFFAVILMLMLTLTLILPIPRRVVTDKLLKRTRNLLAIGTVLIAVQFLLQYIFRFRDYGVAPAVMLNLIFFIPASWVFNVAILYLQRRGNVKRYEWMVGIDTWIICVVIIHATHFITGESLLSDSPVLLYAEIVCSLIYAMMQFFYYYRQYQELQIMRRALNNYYDRDMDDMLVWMEVGVIAMVMIAIPVPIVIFGPTWLLGSYSIVFFVCVYYLVISFVCYVVSNDAHILNEAIAVVDETEKELDQKAQAEPLSDYEYHRIENVVKRWLDRGGHLRCGITIQTAAAEMKIPRYQLTAWLKTTEQELFSPWLTYLRIEEAKRMMLEHHEWSNDIIAEHCGFASRSYFQTVFRKQTGLTPMQFVETYVKR